MENWAKKDIVKVYRKGVIRIPAKIRKNLKIKDGDFLFVIVKEGKLVYSKAILTALEIFEAEGGEVE